MRNSAAKPFRQDKDQKANVIFYNSVKIIINPVPPVTTEGQNSGIFFFCEDYYLQNPR